MQKETNENINADLGLGSRVAQSSQTRFLNQDGSFNVRRGGLSWIRSQNLYHTLLTISWPKFIFLIVVSYFATNILFAIAYLFCGPEAFQGLPQQTGTGYYLELFFFSVQTLATIGYGRVSPANLAANCIVTIEALVGLLGIALATGILFARFSRPGAKILFSRNALIAPFRGGKAFEFRIANSRTSELIDVNATIVFAYIERVDGQPVRRFKPLALERPNVMFFPLHWVIVHPIDESSPLHLLTAENLADSDAEFLVMLTAFDETFSQTVNTRSSYKYNDVVWGAKFSDIFVPTDDKLITIDMQKLSDFERVI